jgi:ectoine hydroxylase-related dioxygenase (phytanoyl-CoA dioxygenase family)
MNEAWSDEKINEAAREIEEKGYTILRDAVPADQLARLNVRTGELIEAEKEGVSRFPAGKKAWESLHRLRDLVALDPMYREMALYDPITRIVEKLLGPGYILFASAVNEVGPGAVAMRLHVDDLLLRLPRPFPRPLLLNSLWALTEFTVENGGTRLIPGSQHVVMNDPAEAETVQPPMDPGSILLYQGSVVHGAGRNTTADRWRRAMIFTYFAGFIRTFESPLKRIPIQELRAMSPELRQLLSFDYWTDPSLPRLY